MYENKYLRVVQECDLSNLLQHLPSPSPFVKHWRGLEGNGKGSSHDGERISALVQAGAAKLSIHLCRICKIRFFGTECWEGMI